MVSCENVLIKINKPRGNFYKYFQRKQNKNSLVLFQIAQDDSNATKNLHKQDYQQQVGCYVI